MHLTPSSPLFSGLPVRHLIQSVNFKPKNVDEEIALGIVFETTEQTLKARSSSHLTNSTTSDHQIRFPLRDRVSRSMAKLAAAVAAQIPQNTSLQVQLLEDDFLSKEFFISLPNTKIKFLAEAQNQSQNLLTTQEQQVTNWLRSPETHIAEILQKARERMYASDYRSAYGILSGLPENLKTDDISHLLGLCTNFFGRTDESELHFRRGLESANPHAQVRASYVIAMLYLRMHKKEKQSLEVAETLLEKAYKVLDENPQLTDWTFHRVFNRNGYALCLYRRGKVEEALQMLEVGIQTLKDNHAGANRLHQSVLIYNAVQCLRTLKRYNECEKMCEELLDIDPTFPEYHLEQARTFLDQDKIEAALSSIHNAINLDAFIPEAYALQGFAYLQIGNIQLAAMGYRHAIRLKPEGQRLKLDLGYCLSELGARAELGELLASMNLKTMSQDEREGWQALKDET